MVKVNIILYINRKVIELQQLSTVTQLDTEDILTLSKHQTNPVSDRSVQSKRLQRDETQSSIESEESIEVPTPQVLPLVDDVFRLHTAIIITIFVSGQYYY